METADDELTAMAMNNVTSQPATMNPQGYGMMNPVMNPGYQPGDEKLYVRFFQKPKQNSTKTKRAGRPIFEDTDYIEIMQPGNKESIIQRPVTKRDIERFQIQYQKYKANEDQRIIGMPLEEAPFVTRSQVEELKYMNIFTVEQLAGLTDAHAQNGRGFQTLKQKAQVWLDSAKDNQGSAQLVEEVTDLKNQLAASLENNKVLMKRLDDMEAQMEQSKEPHVSEVVEDEEDTLEE